MQECKSSLRQDLGSHQPAGHDGTWHTADATLMSTGRQFSCFRASFSFAGVGLVVEYTW